MSLLVQSQKIGDTAMDFLFGIVLLLHGAAFGCFFRATHRADGVQSSVDCVRVVAVLSAEFLLKKGWHFVL